MDSININTYEAYILDLVEGTISDVDRAALERFFESHPDIRAEVQDFELITLSPTSTPSHPNKESLYKDVATTKIYPIARMKWLAVASVALMIGVSLYQFQSRNTEVLSKPVLATENIKHRTLPHEKIAHDEEKQNPALMPRESSSASPIMEAKSIESYTQLEKVNTAMKSVQHNLVTSSNSKHAANNSKVIEKNSPFIAHSTQEPRQKPKMVQLKDGIETNNMIVSISPLASEARPLKIKTSKTRFNKEMDKKIKGILVEAKRQNKENKRPLFNYTGRLVFANASASFIPSYLKQLTVNNKK